MTFFQEAGPAGQQNNKKASFRCSFCPEFREDVIYAGASLNPDDITSRKGSKKAPEMPQTCFPMTGGCPDRLRAHRICRLACFPMTGGSIKKEKYQKGPVAAAAGPSFQLFLCFSGSDCCPGEL
ncbi:MAG: hypothetical protein LKG56_09015 [Lachnospiraceae bacterium]|jgi:hypothetical protein|nr:hypothetical protein [Lachnospiraceae bacterium]MCH4069916.1 hypothetical protein [Lachnospiraceae bacterium]MCH4107862.1 hypothetical protein [Lachnospiraceae bacterium]MCI1332409.1 hypothetical protein [Lachnospiraceae bacterium]MCI1361796.1 hypothetical protein [Lachnospiraceae bacterium]